MLHPYFCNHYQATITVSCSSSSTHSQFNTISILCSVFNKTKNCVLWYNCYCSVLFYSSFSDLLTVVSLHLGILALWDSNSLLPSCDSRDLGASAVGINDYPSEHASSAVSVLHPLFLLGSLFSFNSGVPQPYGQRTDAAV